MKVKLTKLNEISRSDKDLDTILDFIKFVASKLELQGDIHVCLVGSSDGHGGFSTGGFDVYSNKISIREYGRSLVDILRSLAHEMVHFRQKEMQKFTPGDEIPNIGGEIEDEANALCGQLVKMYVHEKDNKWLYTY